MKIEFDDGKVKLYKAGTVVAVMEDVVDKEARILAAVIDLINRELIDDRVKARVALYVAQRFEN